jgi:serine/threonine-protein kinase RsbT
VADEQRVVIAGEDGIVAARQTARVTARAMGFSMVDQSRIATAVSELARNVVRYATGGIGEAIIRTVGETDQIRGIEIVVRDNGPGITDIQLALRDGFTSGSGLGMGLPGTRRLMDDFAIDSAPGTGTTVTIRKWRR